MNLTVIFRNDAPMILAGDTPSYRSIQIELTPDQVIKLHRKEVGSDRGNTLYEDYSKCFLED